MFIVTTAQMQATEQAADESGLSYEQMMENAGYAVAQGITQTFDLARKRVLVLVGPGNNGGDGLVVARHLSQGEAMVSVYVWKRTLQDDPNLEALDEKFVQLIIAEDDSSETQLSHVLDEAYIIVDSLLGTGVSRPIEGTLAELLDQTRLVVQTQRRGSTTELLTDPTDPYFPPDGPYVVAVDIPSGLRSDSGEADPYTLHADLTVTLAAVKWGHVLQEGPDYSGRLLIGDIGIEAEHYPDDLSIELMIGATVQAMLPARKPSAHKGTFGQAMLVAGSSNYPGAAILATKSAAHSGVGLVTVACPQTTQSILGAHIAEATYLPLPDAGQGTLSREAVTSLLPKLDGVDALLIGPGLGQASATRQFLERLLEADFAETGPPPLVIDADGLNLLAKQDGWWELLPPNSILTPHPGEMARLMNSTIAEVQGDRLHVAQEMATKWQQVVLLKGPYTIIAAPNGIVRVLPFANPALAKAGSGDLLAGLITGWLAQGLPPFDAATVGGYIHGIVGELAYEQLGPTAITAQDLLNLVPQAVQLVSDE